MTAPFEAPRWCDDYDDLKKGKSLKPLDGSDTSYRDTCIELLKQVFERNNTFWAKLESLGKSSFEGSPQELSNMLQPITDRQKYLDDPTYLDNSKDEDVEICLDRAAELVRLYILRE